MFYAIRQLFYKSVLVLCIVGQILLINLVAVNDQFAWASIRTIVENNHQLLIQSRHTLKDKQGNSWQVVLFERLKTDDHQTTEIHLRLVGFPELIDFLHPQLLNIHDYQGNSWQAPDIFAQKSPAPNVGEFELQSILADLPLTQLKLDVKMKDGRSIELLIPAEIVLEWQNINS